MGEPLCLKKIIDQKVQKIMKLPARRAGPFDRAHGPEYVERASRARSGEQDASKGNSILIVPLPACRQAGTPPARRGRSTELTALSMSKGLAGHLPVKKKSGGDFLHLSGMRARCSQS